MMITHRESVIENCLNEESFKAFGKQIINWNSYIKGGSNFIQFSFVITDFDFLAAKKAYRRLFETHEALRTTFAYKDNDVIQLINPYNTNNYNLDLYEVGTGKRLDALLKSIIYRYKKKLSNLETGPLAKGAVLGYEHKYYFIFIIHHIIADAYSVNIIKEDIFTLYNNFKWKKFISTQSGKLQLKDITSFLLKHYDVKKVRQHWERLMGNVCDEINYKSLYQNYLKSLKTYSSNSNLILKKFTLNKDNYSKVVNYSSGCSFKHFLSLELFNKVYQKTKVPNASPHTLLLSVLSVLFYKIFTEKAIFFVLRVDGRAAIKSKRVVGNLTGVVFLISSFDDSMSFENVLQLVSDNFYKSIPNIVYDVKKLENVPVFTGSHVCTNYFHANRKIDLEKSKLKKHLTKAIYFPLSLEFVTFHNAISLNWIYNPLIYRKNMVEYLANAYTGLLKHLLNDQSGKLKDIDFNSIANEITINK